MKCPSCGCENREGARFCGECAAPLAEALVCTKCGTANPKGRKFCDSCGNRIGDVANRVQQSDPRFYTPKHLAEKILTSRSALEGERKQVTVLFVDVKGSMDLAEQEPRMIGVFPYASNVGDGIEAYIVRSLRGDRSAEDD